MQVGRSFQASGSTLNNNVNDDDDDIIIDERKLDIIIDERKLDIIIDERKLDDDSVPAHRNTGGSTSNKNGCDGVLKQHPTPR